MKAIVCNRYNKLCKGGQKILYRLKKLRTTIEFTLVKLIITFNDWL